MRISLLLAAAGLGVGLCASAAWAGEPARRFVRASATAGGDGLSWATAFNSLQDAIEAAEQDFAIAEIWVARGVYRPTRREVPATARTETFRIRSGLSVFGGFYGDEESESAPPITERRYPTVLSGDLDDNDGSQVVSDNAFTVVTFASSGTLEGFTIERGRAVGGGFSVGGGARATGEGGMATLRHCRLQFNVAADGGAFFVGSGMSARVEACHFEDNSSLDDGGAIYSDADVLVVVNSAFLRNFAGGDDGEGGGIFVGGPFNTVTNCTFISNAGTVGAGGVKAFAPSLSVKNSIFWGNVGGESTVELNQAAGNFVGVTYSIVQGLGTFYGAGQGNLASNPLMVAVHPGDDGMWNTPDDIPGPVPAIDSPAVNAGFNDADIDNSNEGFDPLPATDLRGLPRIVDCNDPNPPANVDMGAAEVQPGEPSFWLQSEFGNWFQESNWLGGVIAQGCTSAVFGGLQAPYFVNGVWIPSFFLTSPANMQVLNAAVYLSVGQGAFLDVGGNFSGADGFVLVNGGLLDVSSSGKFSSNGVTRRLIVGDDASSHLSIQYFSMQALDELRVGGPESSVFINYGATLTAGDLNVALRADEAASVFVGGGSFLSAGGPAVIGGRGSGVAFVGAGGELMLAGPATIGLNSESGGVVEVDVGGELNAQDLLIVGGAGYGAVYNYGQVNAETVRIGAAPGGQGAFYAEPGSETWAAESIEVGPVGGGVGELVLHSPMGFFTPLAVVGPGSTISGVGAATMSIDNRGIVSPGLEGNDYAGDTLYLEGDYTQRRLPGQDASNSGSLVIDVQTSGSEIFHDRLLASGLASLGGGLFLRPIEGFSPTPGASLPIIEATFIEGRFDVVFTPFLSDGRFLRVRYVPGTSRERGSGGAVVMYVDVFNGMLEFDEPETVEVPAGSSASAAAVEFFDGDAFIDLAVTLPSDNPFDPGCVLVLSNGGASGEEWNGFTIAQCVTVGRDPSAVASIDVNADGRPDLIISNRNDNSVTVLLNDGFGDFSLFPPMTLPVGAAPVDVAAGDLNGDGFVDIVTADEAAGGVSVIFGLAPGFFAPAIFVPTGDSPSSVLIADLDDAPGLEIAVANRGSGTITIIGDNGLFAIGGIANLDLGDGASPDDLDSSDVDNDKDVDLVASNPSPPAGSAGTSGSVAVVRRDRASPNSFAAPVAIPAGDEPGSVALSDIDGDCDPDILVVTADTPRNGQFVRVIRNDLLPSDQQLVFTPWQDLAFDAPPTFVLPADVNGDGLEDVITLNTIAPGLLRGVSSSQISVLLNAYSPPVPGDVNGDGLVNMSDLMLILANFNTFGIGVPGDLDGDDFVGFTDLNIVLSNFNQ